MKFVAIFCVAIALIGFIPRDVGQDLAANPCNPQQKQCY